MAASTDGLRIVVFGLPGAGKSSLLGALGQAAQTQEHLLHGRLKDVSHGLADLQTRLYEGEPQRTLEEVVPYPVVFEPFEAGTGAPVAGVVLDCDGHVASQLVAHPEVLDDGKPSGELATEVVRADALILVVDASASPEQLEADFTAFDRFLREMEEGRSERTDVGGLPVFLVLTKCDLLAKQGDTTIDWVERIEQRKREVDEHFRDFLARRDGEAGPLPFGQLDLQLWATAVKRPALAGSPPRAREPYGVAELFGQCLGGASVYRRRVRQSRRRLVGVVAVAATVVSAMLLLALFLVVRPGARPPSQLQQTIEMLQFAEKPSPSERLQAPLSELRKRRDRFRLLQTDPGFAGLSANLQTFVISRHNEIDKYLEWTEQLQAVRRPVTVDSEVGLRDIKELLVTHGKQRHEEWAETEAVQMYGERLDEVNALLAGVERVQEAYLGDPKKAMKLWSFEGYQNDGGAGVNWRIWSADLEQLRHQFKPATFKQTDRLPGSSKLTYAAVMRIDTVIDAATLQQRLDRMRNLSAALGLIRSIPGKPPVLVIERPPTFKLSMAKGRLDELRTAYPNYKTEFVRSGLPDAFLRELDQAVLTNYEFLLDPARERVLDQLQKAGDGDKETAARWKPVREWLQHDPEELASWRVLALLLVRLYDSLAPDPVTALSAFLHETTFSLDARRITLEVPDSLRVRAPSSAVLSVYHKSVDEPALVYEQNGEGKRDPERRVTVHTFERKKGGRLIYLPGDDLWATLPLLDNKQLTWARNRSTMFQFERLLRAPNLHKVGEAITMGEAAESIRVEIAPPEGWPRVPDLLPVVKFKR